MMIFYIVIIVCVIIVLIWSIILQQIQKRKAITQSINKKLLKIRFPRPDKNEKSTENIKKFEQLISTLAPAGEIVFEIAIQNSKNTVDFFLAVDAQYTDGVTKQIYSQFPNYEVTIANDYTIFKDNNEVEVDIFQFTKPFFLPIKTYTTSDIDTFSSILASFTNVAQEGEGIALQLVVRSAPKKIKNAFVNSIKQLESGKKLKEVVFEFNHPILSFLVELVSGFFSQKSDTKELSKDTNSIQLIQTKSTKQLFQADVRLIASTGSKERNSAILSSVHLAMQGFEAPNGNNFEIKKRYSVRKSLYNFIFRNFFEANSLVLNSEEIASIFHFPTNESTVQGIDWILARQQETTFNSAHPAPKQQDNTRTQGVFKEGFIHIGDSIYRNERKPFFLSQDDRRRHFYSIGQTGTGKSALMKYLAYQDMVLGNGVCVLDPNGDLIEDLLGVIPSHRHKDVIVFDPSNLSNPLGLNMLEHNPNNKEEKTFIVNEMQAIFNRLFNADTMGPVFEQYMRNSLLLLMEDTEHDPPTLLDVPRLLTDTDFRNTKLERSKNNVVNEFWKREVSAVEGEASLSNIAPYITSKFNGFIANDYLRPIIGQPHSSFNFRDVMDSKKILLVKLSKGRLGEISSNLIGMMVIGKLMLAAFGRDNIPQEDRIDFYCYLDEFQNFSTDTIATILSEARKYRLNLTLTHQFIKQLIDPIKNAVFGNVGTIASFRIGGEDTQFISQQFNGAYTENELTQIPNLSGVIRLLENGQPLSPFLYTIQFAPKGDVAVARAIKELSQSRYGRALEDVEKYIAMRTNVR